MRGRHILLAVLILIVALFAGHRWLRTSRQPVAESPAPPASAESVPEPAALPETAPPPGLPIVAWGPRDSFQVIRHPWFISARQGDTALAADEPVLGVVIDGEARAYSTNQLNRHEMVIDQIGETPILVTY
jgi:hypothetical protein